MNGKSVILWVLLISIVLPGKTLGQQLYFERVTGLTETPSTPIHGIAKDSVGYIWFGSWNGVYRYDGKTFDEFRHKTGDVHTLPNNRIRNLIIDQNKSLWVLTFDRRIVKYNYSLNQFEIIRDANVPNLVRTLLNSTPNQLHRNVTLKNKSYYLSAHKLVEEDRRTGEKYTYTAETGKPGSLLDGYVTSFFIDDQEILWVGTRSGDIFKANTHRKPFYLNYLQNTGHRADGYATVRALLKTGNELWIGTNNNGVEVYREKQHIQNHPVQQLLSENQQVRSFLHDSQGNIWIGGVNGLNVYLPKAQKLLPIIDKQIPSDLTIHSVYTMHEKNESIWVGLYNGLAKVSLQDYQITFYDLAEVIQGHSVMDLLWDKNNHLWLATEGNGLVRLSFNLSGQITDTLSLNSVQNTDFGGFQGDMVYSLFEDANNAIWAATTDGLFKIDLSNLSTTHFSVLNGLPDNYIASVTGDAIGNIWISHKKGISKLQPESGAILNYKIRDNQEAWTFMDKSIFNDKNNRIIYFGSRDGYVSFHPSEIEVNPYQPKVILKDLFLSGERVIPREKSNNRAVLNKALFQTKALKLNYAERNFALEIAALHYENPGDIQLYYKLQGYTDGWLQTRQNQIPFTRVPAGHYVFSAKAVSSDNVSSDVVSLPITIHPPWYFSTIAIVCYILLILLTLFAVFRFILYRERLRNTLEIERIKVEKKEELNRQKMEFFTNVSHDLRTPLTLIKDPINQLQKSEVDEKNRSVYLAMIGRNVERLTDLINHLLDFRKAEAGKLVVKYSLMDVVEVMRETLQSFELKAKERNIKFAFLPNVSELVGNMDKEKLQQVMTNLVSNALKYTPDNGNVSVIATYADQDKRLKLQVKDNGVGIDRKSLKNIFEPFNNEGSKPFYGYSSGMGLALTNKLIEILKGKITIDSAPEQGTTVTISLPFDKTKKLKPKTSEPQASSKVSLPEPGNKTLTERGEKLKKPLLLIVEDSADVLAYLSAELKNDYEIASKTNGLDGLKTALGKMPDLIISDVMMPKMDGITLCENVKKNEKTSHIPVILLTAKTSDESQVEGLQIGADIYLAKPFNIDVLKAQIASLLKNRSKLKAHLSQTKYVSELKKGENKQDNAFVLKVIKSIEKHIEKQELNPDYLAEDLNLSRRQLYRKLEAVSGSTVQEFIIRVRMEKSSELLLSSNLNIAQIADKLGFSEASNFSRTFTKHFGQSPTKYKKAHTG